MNKLYIFEGVDGSGKTTLAKSFSNAIGAVYYKGLPKRLHPYKHFVDTRLPPILRYWFYRVGNLLSYREIGKLLNETAVVVDQYIYCTLAFHRVSLNKVIKKSQPTVKPDVIFYLSAPWKEIDTRLNERGGRKKLEELSYLQKVDKAYRQLFEGMENVIYFDTGNSDNNTNIKELLKRRLD